MTKQEYLARLERALAGLPEAELRERLAFYGEMIEDRMEEGLTEEEAVNGMDPVESIAAGIVEETPPAGPIREKVRPKRRLKGWEIVLIVLGFPLWFPLLAAAFAVLLAVYVVLWAVVAALWAVELALAVSAIGLVVAGIVFIVRGSGMHGSLMLSGSAVCAGIAILLFFGCKGVTKGAAVLTKKIALGIKSLFMGKEKTE